jgi:hypothetical protein
LKFFGLKTSHEIKVKYSEKAGGLISLLRAKPLKSCPRYLTHTGTESGNLMAIIQNAIKIDDELFKKTNFMDFCPDSFTAGCLGLDWRTAFSRRLSCYEKIFGSSRCHCGHGRPERSKTAYCGQALSQRSSAQDAADQ